MHDALQVRKQPYTQSHLLEIYLQASNVVLTKTRSFEDYFSCPITGAVPGLAAGTFPFPPLPTTQYNADGIITNITYYPPVFANSTCSYPDFIPVRSHLYLLAEDQANDDKILEQACRFDFKTLSDSTCCVNAGSDACSAQASHALSCSFQA